MWGQSIEVKLIKVSISWNLKYDKNHILNSNIILIYLSIKISNIKFHLCYSFIKNSLFSLSLFKE